LRHFVQTESEIMGSDPAALAMMCIAGAGGAIHHQTRLHMAKNSDWYVRPALWVMIVGDSGHGKTNIINAAFAPLEQLEKRLYAEYKNAPVCILKNTIEQPPPPPEPRRFIAMDVTIEKVGEMLSKQDSGLIFKVDEIAGWIGGMDRYGGKGTTARAQWLQSFDGGYFCVDRIGRESDRIANYSVSVVGGIQPKRLAEFRGVNQRRTSATIHANHVAMV
jgi:hypothetical protein